MKLTRKNHTESRINELFEEVRALREMCGKVPIRIMRHEYDEYGMIVPLSEVVEAVMAHCGIALEHVPSERERFSVQGAAKEKDK